MKNRDDFGVYRSIHPKNFFPYSAWEIDNEPVIGEHELLASVSLLNLDISCFLQIMETGFGSEEAMAEEIMRIVEQRGKLHNPVTNTGGTLFGRVEKIGSAYSNRYGISEGDEICSLSSLTGTPLKLDKIVSIDTGMAQVRVIGKAVLFENSPLLKKMDGLPDNILLSAIETAGQAMETYRIAEKNDRIVVIGAGGKMGIFCALAARKKLGKSGKLIGCLDGGERTLDPMIAEIFDEVYNIEANDINTLSDTLAPMSSYDLIINCSDRPMSEPCCALLAKPGGVIFFAGWGGNSKAAGLAAETLGKDVDMKYYRGYVEGQAELFKQTCAEHDVSTLLLKGLENDFKHPWLAMLAARKRIVTIGEGILADARDYVFESTPMQELLHTILNVAKFDCNVLITGETGAGKGIVAELIHKRSDRANKPFVKINCASIPEQLLESELFGYEGGAFTGSNPKGKEGLWETADEGVLFLDEIGEMSLLLQSKLLRALEENEIYRVGGSKPISVDVRILAATNKDLYQMVKEKKFREDLYYRLNVFYINVPPLRERRDDILPLIDLMIHKYGRKFGITKTISQEAKDIMATFTWEGNVRELENFIQKLFISSLGAEITIYDVTKQMAVFHENILPTSAAESPDIIRQRRPLSDAEERELLTAYKEEYGSTRKIAKALGTSQSSVVRRLKKYDL
jgi:TyrR family helix-turn-helix protein